MNIVVKSLGKDEMNIFLDEESTVLDLIRAIGIPENADKICLVNGEISQSKKKLKNGDRIEILPLFDGG